MWVDIPTEPPGRVRTRPSSAPTTC